MKGILFGNHTVNHYSLPEISEEKLKNEVMTLHTTLYEKLGYEMKYIRPPKGEYSEKTLSLTNSYGYTTVMWSLAYDIIKYSSRLCDAFTCNFKR